MVTQPGMTYDGGLWPPFIIGQYEIYYGWFGVQLVLGCFFHMLLYDS